MELPVAVRGVRTTSGLYGTARIIGVRSESCWLSARRLQVGDTTILTMMGAGGMSTLRLHRLTRHGRQYSTDATLVRLMIV